MDTRIPEGFIEEMKVCPGAEECSALVEALENTAPVVGVRLNPRKSKDFDGAPVAWCDMGRVLAERPQFTLMPGWHGGAFYVQEPASMIMTAVIERIVNKLGRKDLRYLDMCAAPGGKTTAALSVLPEEAFVVANEFVPARAAILVENLTKWGYPNFAVTCGDTSAYRNLKGAFDIVAVDAPCSGEGMMRKDEEARRQWSPGLVTRCAELQQEIITNAWQTLRPGGYLIYSTCTFNKYEDESILRYAMEELGAENIDLGLNAEFDIPGSIDSSLSALRFMPHRTVGEGLFLGVLHKPGEAALTPSKGKPKKNNSKQKTITSKELNRLLINPETFDYSMTRDGLWRVVPRAYTELVSALEQHTRLLTAGVTLGESKGKSFIPDASLALSTSLAPEAYVAVEVDHQTALSYLRREAIVLPENSPRGIVLICHEGLPLGFAKNLGNRANNLYPHNWRIRHL
ncbi:MAG: rRNA cytosine-C5-methyltransferase [Muribaculaceae bacterium]|nr:rRNA cytosine-C5-methyltransferase [Muribaculaceae bacterium]